MSNSNPIREAPIAADHCGMARASDLPGDRWTLLILRQAFYGVSRFDDIRAGTGAPRAILSERLERLVEAELLRREPYQDPGRRTQQAYLLTERGSALAMVLLALMHWGDRYLRDGPAPMVMVEATTGLPLSVVLATPDGRVVPLDAARPRIRPPPAPGG